MNLFLLFCRLRRLTILAGASALLKAFSNQIDLFFGARSDVDCQVFGCAAVIGYGGSLCFIYVVLWLRQDQLQQLAVLRHLPGRRFRLLLSRVLLIAMLFAFFVLFILNFVTLSVDASAQGCVFTDIGKVSQSVRSTAGLLFTGLFHPAFAALLTYPLIKSNSAVTEAMKGSESANRKTERTRKLIKRVLATLLVVAATDAATIAASYWMETFPAIRIALVYDLNALVGVASLLFSFSDWRKRLRFCRLRHQQTDQTASMSSAWKKEKLTITAFAKWTKSWLKNLLAFPKLYLCYALDM